MYTKICLNRQIWQIDAEYPEGVEANGVKYLNAKVTTVIDAETGEWVWLTVASNEAKSSR